MLSRRRFVAVIAALQVGAAAKARAEPSARSLAEALGGAESPGVLRAGHYSVREDLVVERDLLLQPDVIIDVDGGKTLTLRGGFLAPIANIFAGRGTVDLNFSRTECAYPEWWGARPDDGAFDCLPALQACVAAHPETRLASRDYFISRTWKIERPDCRIWGAGSPWQGPGKGTRIVVTNDRDDVVVVGPSAKPANVNLFLQGVDMRWMELARSAPGRSLAGKRDFDAAAGLRAEYLLRCHFEGLTAPEHAIGFAVRGAVRTFLRNCSAFRSLSSIAPELDIFHGFHFDGQEEIGLAGGNASIFVVECSASVGGAPPLKRSIGAFLDGAFADTFLNDFETTTVATGILVEGLAKSGDAGRRKTGNVNLHIRMPILDQCTVSGIEFDSLSDYAMVDVSSPYVALANDARAAIETRASQGQITISGGQLIGWGNRDSGGSAVGLLGFRGGGLFVSGLKLLGFRRPVDLTQCVDFSLEIGINNPDQKAGPPAIRLRDCARGWLRPQIKGSAEAFLAGVQLEGPDTKDVRVEGGLIDPASVRGGAGAMVRALEGAVAPVTTAS